MRNPKRTADVAARLVQLKLGCGFAEVIGGVVGRVAIELIDFAVEVMRAGLEHHEDRAAGADTVIGTIVAIQSLEFGHCILRGQVHEASAAAAIILLSPVHQVDVMSRTGPVEADAIGRGQRVDAAKWRQGVRDAKTERRQRRDIATIGCQLRNLLAADQRAYFACFALHL